MQPSESPWRSAITGAVLVLLTSAPSAQTEQKLHASDGASGDEFGRSVAMDEEAILVGSRRAAYLFSATSGLELRRFTPTGVGVDESFGSSVALSDRLVVVGSPVGTVFSSDVGAVYVFDRTTGTQLRRIETDLDSRQEFGAAVAVNDRWLVVGDPDVPPWTGDVHLYSATTFQRIEVIYPSNLPPGAKFGFGQRLALDGNRLAASLWIGQTGGAVMLLDLPSGPRRGMLSPAGAEFDGFGEGLALKGTRLVVGMPWSVYSPNPTQPGAAFAFDWDTLALLDTITPSTSAASDRFGAHVAIEGRTYAISGTRGDVDTTFVFDAASSVDTLRHAASDGATGDGFGPVAVNRGRRAVGAPGDDDLGIDSGSVYLYACSPADGDCDCDGLLDVTEMDCDLDGTPDDCEDDFDENGVADDCQMIGPYCVELPCPCGNDDGSTGARGCTNSTGVGARLYATGTSSVAADDFTLVASDLPPSAPLLLFVADDLDAASPIGDGVTCTGGRSYRYAMSGAAPNGTATFKNSLSSAPTNYMLPGLTRGFQLYYHDGGCTPRSCSACGSAVNLTNGVRVLLAP